ncbi:MAG: hypothetical protein PF638_09335 [Candidatus Delongbacteria bacterium]|nr:hypothetical protein [Candidatus Delongbacteria bacterium]
MSDYKDMLTEQIFQRFGIHFTNSNSNPKFINLLYASLDLKFLIEILMETYYYMIRDFIPERKNGIKFNEMNNVEYICKKKELVVPAIQFYRRLGEINGDTHLDRLKIFKEDEIVKMFSLYKKLIRYIRYPIENKYTKDELIRNRNNLKEIIFNLSALLIRGQSSKVYNVFVSKKDIPKLKNNQYKIFDDFRYGKLNEQQMMTELRK